MPNSEQQGSVGTRVALIDALRGFDMFRIAGGGAIFRSLHKIFFKA